MAWHDATIEPPIDRPTINHNTNNRKVFVDLDGVVANFEQGRIESGLSSAEFKLIPGAYRNLKPYPEALIGVRALIAKGFDVWIATKIPTDAPWAATEKIFWVNQYLPELKKSVIITPNKGTLGTARDFLIDDRPHKAHCEDFEGDFLQFGPTNDFQNWDQVMTYMNRRDPSGKALYDMSLRKYVYAEGMNSCIVTRLDEVAVIPVRHGGFDDEFVWAADLPIMLWPQLGITSSSNLSEMKLSVRAVYESTDDLDGYFIVKYIR